MAWPISYATITHKADEGLGDEQDISQEETNMLSKIPVDIERIKKEDLDKEVLRVAIIAELDAINLYEQMAGMTRDANVKKLLLDVAREEKTHVGEFQTLLLNKDPQQKSELKDGEREVEELLRRKEK